MALSFIYAAIAGVVVGLTFDLFVLCLVMAPFVVLVAMAASAAGLFTALTTAFEAGAVMQAGFMAGLLTRGLAGTRERADPARSSEAGDL